jgi:hypothetical protein
MKKVFLTIVAISLICIVLPAQLILTQESHTGVIPSGPALELNSLQFMHQTEAGSFKSPDVNTSVSFHLNNMQMKADGVIEVLSFGTSYRETMKWPTSEPVYQPMRSIGKSLSKWFNEAESEEGIISVGTQHGVFAFASIKHLSNSHNPKAGEKIYYGDMIVSFNRPVSNPLLHFAGLGGLVEKDGVIRGFSVEMELMTPSASLERTAGTDNFEVLPNYIGNSLDLLSPYCGTGAACGTAKVLGKNLETLLFRVYLKRDSREAGYRNKWPLMRNIHWGDGWVMSVSFEQDLNFSGEVLFADNNPVRNKAEGQLLYVNLIDPSTNITLSTQPIAANGSFNFSGLTGHQSYELQLSILRGVPGTISVPAKLPEEWTHEAAGSFASQFNPGIKSFRIKVQDQDISNIQFLLHPGESSVESIAAIEQPDAKIETESPEVITTEPAPVATIVESPVQPEIIPEPVISTEKEVIITQPMAVAEVTDTEVQKPDAVAEIAPEAPEARPVMASWQEEKMALQEEDCFVIVGSFIMDYNVKRMEQRLVDADHETYVLPGPQKGTNNFTRVGYKIKCEDKDKSLASARRTFDPQSWFLQYEWTPSYGIHYQPKSLWHFNIITSGMDIDPNELKSIMSSKR